MDKEKLVSISTNILPNGRLLIEVHNQKITKLPKIKNSLNQLLEKEIVNIDTVGLFVDSDNVLEFCEKIQPYADYNNNNSFNINLDGQLLFDFVRCD